MAVALVGGAFLSATLQVLFDRLASREVVNFFRGEKHDDKLLYKLKRALRTVNAVLNDAEDKEITNPAVKDWLDDLHDAVYHADDLLDEIATQAMRCKFEAESQSSTNQVRDITSTSVCLLDEDIKQIIENLEYFAKEKDVLGLKDVGRKQSKRVPTTSLVDESAVYGRDDDREKIIKLLLCDDEGANNEIRVIPIVGMGGIGKTTLAQYAYNDRKVDEHFHIKAWVCVSEEFDIFMVTKTILAAVTSSANSDVTDLNQLQVKLREKLSGKKFLIVLDDVWNHNYENWDMLRSPFRGGAQGSKIIVTTRNQSVASIMQTVPTHRLELLSDEDCWSLFAKHAFGNGDPGARPNLESIGKEIVKKCKGLPLAVKALGGVLRSKLEIEEWENILKSSIWDLPQDKNNVPPVLRLSYHYLPSNLKRCFAYCSIFPKDYEFEKEKLVLLWIAQGFVKQPKDNKEIEEEGGNYFCELLSMSFFQQSSANKSHFVMHDLVHDLAQLISGEFCFRLEDNKACNVSEKVRHFSCFSSKYESSEKLKDINEAKCLRTFILFGGGLPYRYDYLHTMLPNLRCLRVLSLSGLMISELPHSIGNQIHLRYLDLSRTHIQQLPDSITNLWNLHTLNLSYCWRLNKLLVDMWKLINLRHLDTRRTQLKEMPMHMCKIRGLQNLSTFVVGKDSGAARIDELKELRHLGGTLAMLQLQNITSSADALEANVKDKKQLRSLELEWDGNSSNSRDERDVLDKLRPNASVKNLIIRKYGGTMFPDWLGEGSYSNLVSLSLEECAYCVCLPPLGQLPSLKELRIEGMNGITHVGVELYGNTTCSNTCLQELYIYDCPSLVSFLLPTTLKKLEIKNCRKLEFPHSLSQCFTSLEYLSIWNSCEDSLKSLPLGFFPKLRTLDIFKCTNLETLSVVVANEIQNLASLDYISIRDCPNMVSFPRGGLPAPNLTWFPLINCKKLKSLPEGMHTLLPSLQSLYISDCPEVESFPEGGLPSNLHSLLIRSCKKLTNNRMEWGLQRLPPYLKYFSIHGDDSLEESFPHEEWLLPSTLTDLHISSLPNLKSLNHKALQHLTSLQTLHILMCPNLQSLPEEGLPTSLSQLTIRNCPLLKARCQRERGKDWSKIAQIPVIHIH